MAGFLLLIWIVLWVAAFVDALLADPARIRVMPKLVWLIGILLLSGFAAIAWFIFGRPRPDGIATADPSTLSSRFRHPSAQRTEDGAGTGWTLGGAGPRRRSGPIAPDDDPDFLRSLGQRRPDQPGDAAGGKPDQPV